MQAEQGAPQCAQCALAVPKMLHGRTQGCWKMPKPSEKRRGKAASVCGVWGGSRIKLQPPPSLPGSPGRGSEKLRPGQDHLTIQQCAGPLAWGRTG